MSRPRRAAVPPPPPARPGPPHPEAAAAPARGPSVAVGLAALALYALLAPGVSADGDGSEFTLVLATGGAAHPTGYPLYTLVGHGFAAALHALGVGWPRAANLFSALGGGLAVGLLHALCARLLPAGLPGGRHARARWALLPTALFALGPVWTREATLAEVYAWHLAWLGGAALCFVAAVEAEGEAARLRRLAGAWGLLGGLGAAHHATAVLAWGVLSVALVLHLRAWPALRLGALLARGALAALPPLLSYGWVAWRAHHPAAAHWPTLEPTAASVWAHVTGQLYRSYLGGFAPGEVHRELLALHVWPVLVPALLVALVAAVRARGARAAALRGLGAAALVLLGYAFAYRIPDPAPYFLGPLALALALAAVALAPVLARARWAQAAAAAGVLVLGVAWLQAARMRNRGLEALEAELHAMWASIPFERAVVLFPDDLWMRLREYQLLRGEKPGVDVVCTPLLWHPAVHAGFRARHGFDPLEATHAAGTQVRLGYVLGDDDPQRGPLLALVHREVASRAAVPVVGFDPVRRSVRLFQPRR